jgi:hypothetical protein
MKTPFVTRFLLLLVMPVVSILFATCNNEVRDDPNKFNIGSFDVSENDQTLIFSLYHQGEVGIYQIDTNGKGFKQILTPTKDSLFFNPQYALANTKIVFIGKSKDTSSNTNVYIANADGSDRERVTDGKEMITEAIYSKCDNKIYYVKANTFGHYSPIASDTPHGMDVYSIDLKSRDIDNVTHLNEYGLFSLSEFDCNNLLFYIPVQEKGGMILFPKDRKSIFSRINPANNPREDLSMYYTSVYSAKYNVLAFIAPYEIYMMDMKSKIAKLVFSNVGATQINDVKILHNTKQLVFTPEGEAGFKITNFNKTGLRTINLPIDSAGNLPQ